MSRRPGHRNWEDLTEYELHEEPHTGNQRLPRSRYRITDEGGGTYTATLGPYTWLVCRSAEGELEVQETDCPHATHLARVLRAIQQQQ